MNKKRFKSMKWWKKTGMIDHLCKSSTVWVKDYSDSDDFYENAPTSDLFSSIFLRNTEIGIDLLRDILNYVYNNIKCPDDIKNEFSIVISQSSPETELKKVDKFFQNRKQSKIYNGPIDRFVMVSNKVMLDKSDIKSFLMIFHFLKGVIENNPSINDSGIRQIICNNVSKNVWNDIVEESDCQVEL